MAAFRTTLLGASFVLAATLTFCMATPPPSRPAEPQPSAPVLAPHAQRAELSPDAAPVDPWTVTPADDGQLSAIDTAVEAAIGAGKLPGCVVVIGRHDTILFKKAYGQRELEPARAPMLLDTVFDLASLTKPIATASSVMILVDRGLVGLGEPVARYIPEFARGGKGSITVRQLLLHTGGLVPDDPMSDYASGKDEALRRILEAPARWPPGERLVYSDVGYIVLAELVRRVAGQDIASFARENVFAPLGMDETAFTPTGALHERAAPTEMRDGGWMQGEVHDPRAFALGGVAGHAGLFSTAHDLSRFARAWLAKTELHGATIVRPATFDAFLAPHDVPGGIRALGWDVESPFTKHRGDGFSRRAFGHSGFTGTSLWIDPEHDVFVLFLSNRVHPYGKGAVHELEAKIGTLASAIVAPSEPAEEPSCDQPTARARAGIDVLKDTGFGPLRGRKIGLVTNASGRAKDGTRTIDLLAHAPGVDLIRIFTPEHGLGADQEGAIADGKDVATGLPIVSLYGATFAPAPESLAGIDTLVFDVQDVGTRFYTYASTMRRAMKAASEARLRFVVLDRPNPIDGIDVAGPLVDPSARNFVHHADIPVRHGMTIGELSLMFDAEDHLGTDLHVIPVRGWRRSDYLDTTGIPWVNPSPNLRSVSEALLYPGIGLLEGTNLSVGRGTEAPFEIVGAPYVDGAALATALTKRALPGVSFTPATFTPHAAPFKGEACQGVRVAVVDRAHFKPIRTGLALAMDLHALYPMAWHFEDVGKLLASKAPLDAIAQGKSLADVEATWEKDLAAFRSKREKYLLYRASCPTNGGSGAIP